MLPQPTDLCLPFPCCRRLPAEVLLNGVALGQAANAHRPHAFAVPPGLLQEGPNQLSVALASPIQAAAQQAAAYPYAVPYTQAGAGQGGAAGALPLLALPRLLSMGGRAHGTGWPSLRHLFLPSTHLPSAMAQIVSGGGHVAPRLPAHAVRCAARAPCLAAATQSERAVQLHPQARLGFRLASRAWLGRCPDALRLHVGSVPGCLPRAAAADSCCEQASGAVHRTAPPSQFNCN